MPVVESLEAAGRLVTHLGGVVLVALGIAVATRGDPIVGAGLTVIGGTVLFVRHNYWTA